MRQLRWIGLAVLLVASVALAGPKTAKLKPKQGVTAAKVAAASKKIVIGTYQNGDDPLTVLCAGEGQSLSCEVQLQDGTVVAQSNSIKVRDEGVVLGFASPEGPYKRLEDVKLVVPGTVLRFGGQDLGE